MPEKNIHDLLKKIQKGRDVLTEVSNRVKREAIRTAAEISKAAKTKTARKAGKIVQEQIGGIRRTIAEKAIQYVRDNPEKFTGGGERDQRIAQSGKDVGMAIAIGGKFVWDKVTEALRRVGDFAENKQREFTVADSIPELLGVKRCMKKYQSLGETLEKMTLRDDFGSTYVITKGKNEIKIEASSPDQKRKIELSYFVQDPSEFDSLTEEMEHISNDLLNAILEYNQDGIESFEKATRKIKIGQDKKYIGVFQKKDKQLAFHYSKEQGQNGRIFSRKTPTSRIEFKGEGVNLVRAIEEHYQDNES